MAMGADRIKDLFRRYGKIALGVHLTVYASFFSGEAKTRTSGRLVVLTRPAKSGAQSTRAASHTSPVRRRRYHPLIKLGASLQAAILPSRTALTLEGRWKRLACCPVSVLFG